MENMTVGAGESSREARFEKVAVRVSISKKKIFVYLEGGTARQIVSF